MKIHLLHNIKYIYLIIIYCYSIIVCVSILKNIVPVTTCSTTACHQWYESPRLNNVLDYLVCHTCLYGLNLDERAFTAGNQVRRCQTLWLGFLTIPIILLMPFPLNVQYPSLWATSWWLVNWIHLYSAFLTYGNLYQTRFTICGSH
jgi:hypothetical protein